MFLIHIMEHIVSKKVSPIPRGYRTATPVLTVFDIDSAVAFYQAAFGAELLTRGAGADNVAVHASIKIGNSIILLNREAPQQGIFSPLSLGGTAGHTHLYVENVDTSWERAIEAGARIQVPLADTYWGDRSGVLVDGNGHLWSIASKIENVSQDEIARRAQIGVEQPLEPVAEYGEPAVQAYPLETAAGDEILAAEYVAV
jgi:PhnB protein